MDIRDRIVEFKRVKAAELRPNPRNWRLHPQAQQDALRGILSEVGYVDALLVRTLTDGALELIDGHLRAKTTPDSLVPVLVVDLNDEEAAKVLATFDPLAAMAETSVEQLGDLMQQFDTTNEALRKMLDRLTERNPCVRSSDEKLSPTRIPERWAILVNCASEAEQVRLLEQFNREGISCRALIA